MGLCWAGQGQKLCGSEISGAARLLTVWGEMWMLLQNPATWNGDVSTRFPVAKVTFLKARAANNYWILTGLSKAVDTFFFDSNLGICRMFFFRGISNLNLSPIRLNGLTEIPQTKVEKDVKMSYVYKELNALSFNL